MQLPRIAAAFAARLPRARLRVVGIDSLVALGGLAGTEVDLAFGVPERAPGMHAERIGTEPLALVARADHPAVRARQARRALDALRHVAVEMIPGRGYADPVDRVYAKAGVARDVALTVPTFSTAAAVVAATDYVTSLPTSLLDHLAPRLRLKVVKGPVPAHDVTLHLWWHERTHTDAALVAFRGLVRDVLRPSS